MFRIEAAIVRIMKARKRSAHNVLVAEVTIWKVASNIRNVICVVYGTAESKISSQSNDHQEKNRRFDRTRLLSPSS